MGQSTVQSRSKAVWALAVEQHGAIYTPAAEFEDLGDVDALIAKHNRLLPPTYRHAPRKLKHENGHVFIVGYEELLRRGEITGQFAKNPLQSLVAVAVMYMLVNMALSRVARRLEVRQRRRYDAGAIQVAGVEDLAVIQAHGEAEV